MILLSDSSMLANLVFLVEVGSCTPLILWAHFVSSFMFYDFVL